MPRKVVNDSFILRRCTRKVCACYQMLYDKPAITMQEATSYRACLFRTIVNKKKDPGYPPLL